MFIAEYTKTNHDTGESELIQLTANTFTDACTLIEQAKCDPDGFPHPYIANSNFMIHEIS